MTRARDLADFNLDGKAVTVNESSADLDFRVESNGNANMLFVDGGNDKVAIGTGTAVGTLTTECTAGDSNFALTAYHPTSTSARNIAKFQSNVGSTQADVVTIGCDGGIEAIGEITSTGGSLSQNSNGIRTVIGNDGGSGTFGTSTNHQVKMFTNNTHVATLTTGGNFNILDGDLVIGTSGHGIDFSATSDTSGAGSELLDDYEEGTWTGTLEGSTTNPSTTVAISSFRYTKIGRLVFVQGQFSNVDTTGAAGAPRITGLPFGAATSYATGNVMFYNRFTIGTTSANVSPYVASNTMYFYQSTNQSSWAEVAHSAGAAAYLAFTAVYEV